MAWFRPKDPDSGSGADEPRFVIPGMYQPAAESLETIEKPPSRVNLRALIFLLALVILTPIVGFGLWSYQGHRLRRVALDQAKALADEGQVERSLINIGHLLQEWPDDIEALDLQARLLTDTVQTPDQALEAAKVQDHLLRLDPVGPARQQNRARLVELYLAFADAVRYTSTRRETAIDRFEGRYRVAVKIAEQRIAFGADDAESHRLLAQALEGVSLSGDAAALSAATDQYELALRRDPRDSVSAERLALILLEKRNDPSAADKIIEALLNADPESVTTRLVRHRYFRKTQREDRARAELEAAARLAPGDIRVRLTAAGDAIQRRDVADARKHLNAIPARYDKDKRVLIFRGQLDLAEQHPDEAVEEWRRGLLLSGGNDRDLTCRLVHVLILQGRLDEARPLLDQYERLETHETTPMIRFLNGLLKERTGRPAAAIVDLEAARAEIDEVTMIEVELVLGRCYEAINDQNKALLCYRRAVEAAPTSAVARRSLARQLGKKSREKAAEELEKALKRIPNDSNLLGDLAANYLAIQLTRPAEERDVGPVLALVERGEKLGLDPLAILKLRAEALSISGHLDQALGLLEAASKGPLKGQEEVWLLWATGLIQSGQSPRALRVLDRATDPGLAGDHLALRLARAKLHVQAGHAREARALLTDRPESLPPDERAALAGARADLLHNLGDLRAAREACIEWGKLARNDPQPGLKLLAIAQTEGVDGEETSKIGLELLRAVGGDEEPYSLAARGFDLLLSNRQKSETHSTRLKLAEELSARLQKMAPDLPVSYLLRGIIKERNHQTDDAIADYRMALGGNTSTVALSRLIDLFTRLKRYRDLALLKREYGSSTAIDQLSASAFLGIGDSEGASRMIAQVVESAPDDVQVRSIQARILGDAGQTQEAERSFQALIERNKNLPEPWLALLEFQKARGLKEQAARTLELARTSYEGENPELFQARCRSIAGDPKEAARLFGLAIARSPNDPSVLRFAAEFEEASGRLDGAENLLRKAIKLDGSVSWARRRLALLLSVHNDRRSWDEAWSLLAPDSSRGADDPEDRLIRATLLERSPYKARRAEATPELIALAEDLPSNQPIAVEARGRLARSYLDANRPDEASRVIEPVAEGSNASNPSTLALLVEALARSGKLDEATSKLAELTSLEPKSARTACCRAWLHQARGRKPEASATLENAFQESKDLADPAESGMMLYRLLLNFGDFEAAERVARQIVDARPRDGWLLARLQNFRGNYPAALQSSRVADDAGGGKDAISVLVELAATPRADEAVRREAGALAESILARTPNDPDLVLMIGSLKHREGKYDEEGRLYSGALRANPSHENLLNNWAWILSEFLDRPAEALTKVDQAIRSGGRNPSFCDTRGVILTRLGRFQDSINDLEEAVRDTPSPTRLFHLARASLKGGDPEKHRKYRDLARKASLDPSMLDPRDRGDFDAVMTP